MAKHARFVVAVGRGCTLLLLLLGLAGAAALAPENSSLLWTAAIGTILVAGSLGTVMRAYFQKKNRYLTAASGVLRKSTRRPRARRLANARRMTATRHLRQRVQQLRFRPRAASPRDNSFSQ